MNELDLPLHPSEPPQPPQSPQSAQPPQPPFQAPPGTLAFPQRVHPGTPGPLRESDAEVLPMRPREKVKRLKAPLWIRLLSPLMAATAIVGVPAVVVYWLLTSPSFALEQTRFAAASQSRRVPQAWVEQTVRSFEGRNIWQLPLGEVESALEKHPWVAAVGLLKAPPRTLVVQIVERSEVALYRQGQELQFVDGEGKLIDRYDPRGSSADLPILSGGDTAFLLPSAMSLLRELEAAQPGWSAGLSELEILGAQDFRLYTAELPFPLLVRAGTLGDKTRRLQALLPQIVDRYPHLEAVDLRFARRIILQPMEGTEVKAHAKAPARS